MGVGRIHHSVSKLSIRFRFSDTQVVTGSWNSESRSGPNACCHNDSFHSDKVLVSLCEPAADLQLLVTETRITTHKR